MRVRVVKDGHVWHDREEVSVEEAVVAAALESQEGPGKLLVDSWSGGQYEQWWVSVPSGEASRLSS